MASQGEIKENKQILQELPKPEAVQLPEPGQANTSSQDNGSTKESSKDQEGGNKDVAMDGKKSEEEFQLGVAVSVYQNSGTP